MCSEHAHSRLTRVVRARSFIFSLNPNSTEAGGISFGQQTNFIAHVRTRRVAWHALRPLPAHAHAPPPQTSDALKDYMKVRVAAHHSRCVCGFASR